MKKSLITVVATLVLLASPAFAETSVAVVNVAKIVKDSKAMSSVRTQVQAKQKAFQNEYDAKDKALQAENQALIKQQASADKAAFEKKVKDFRAKAASEMRSVQDKKASIDKASTVALEEVQKATQDIVKQIATEKKLNLVVSSAAVLYGEDSLDITDEVLKRLDSKLPSVAVKF